MYSISRDLRAPTRINVLYQTRAAWPNVCVCRPGSDPLVARQEETTLGGTREAGESTSGFIVATVASTKMSDLGC